MIKYGILFFFLILFQSVLFIKPVYAQEDETRLAIAISAYDQKEYETAYKAATEQVKILRAEFEKTRQDKIKDIAAMKIDVDPRFQKTIDIFLPKVSAE